MRRCRQPEAICPKCLARAKVIRGRPYKGRYKQVFQCVRCEFEWKRLMPIQDEQPSELDVLWDTSDG